jgi:hypothetical protein
MWFYDLPWHPAQCFYNPQRMGWIDQKETPKYVPWSSYCIRQIGMEYSIMDAMYGFTAKKREKRRSITVWDIWRFFQGSFVKALTDWKILDDEELASIERMKRKRSTFAADEISDEIIDYCLRECKSGVALMTKLDRTCADLGYPLGRFDGAGSLAAAMLKAWKIKDYMADVPEEMIDAVSCAYFGGRFEIAAHGRTYKPVWQYDINSAYPHIIRNLPCLACAEWEASRDVQEEGIYYVRWNAGQDGNYWGAFPHRNRRGEITYPRCGSGWYWGSEILAANRLYPGSFRILKGWNLLRKCVHIPFERIPDVYQQRRELGSDAAGIVLKLGLNSLYGKTAQSIGRPQYANYIWAGMITAGTRAMLLDAIRLAGPENILMTATDAVFSTVEIDLPISKTLGEWSVTHIPAGLLIIQPGITIAYQSDGTGTYKSRGLGKYEFAAHADAAERAWDRLGVMGSFEAQTHRFIGIKTALGRNRYELRCRWVDVTNRLRFFPGSKRDLPDAELLAHLERRQAISYAITGDGKPSIPYDRIKNRLEYDNATEIGEQPALECDWLEVTA